jgi:putative PIN family toxin of toxin-antitoxin system
VKVVLDTNILVSAVLRGRIPKMVVQFIIDSPDYEWMVSTEILREYKEVLSRPKFKLTQDTLDEWWEVFDTVPKLVEVDREVDFSRDEKDAKFLACALATESDYLITGDKDFTEVRNLGKTRIITASLFKQLSIDPIN